MRYENPLNGAQYEAWEIEEMAIDANVSVEELIRSRGYVVIEDSVQDVPNWELDFEEQESIPATIAAPTSANEIISPYGVDEQGNPINIQPIAIGELSNKSFGWQHDLENSIVRPTRSNDYHEDMEAKGDKIRYDGEIGEGQSNVEHTGSIDEWRDELGLMAFESSAVDYLNNIYPSDKVRFVETDAGDTVEVLVGDQEEGQGQKWNLAFWDKSENDIVFQEIEQYVNNWGEIDPKVTYEEGDLGNTQELGLVPSGTKTISLYEQPEDYASTDKTKVVEKLKDLFPEKTTGFKFGFGVKEDQLGYKKGVEIIAPNGARYFQYTVSEQNIKDFINSNSYSLSGLERIKQDRLNLDIILSENLLRTAENTINKEESNILGTIDEDFRFDADQKDPVSKIVNHYMQHKDAVKNALYENIGGKGKYPLRFYDEAFDRVFYGALQQETQESFSKTLSIMGNMLESDKEDYERFIKTSEEQMLSSLPVEQQGVARLFTEIINLNKQASELPLDSEERQKIQEKINQKTAEHQNLWNLYFSSGQDRMLFNADGSRVEKPEIYMVPNNGQNPAIPKYDPKLPEGPNNLKMIPDVEKMEEDNVSDATAQVQSYTDQLSKYLLKDYYGKTVDSDRDVLSIARDFYFTDKQTFNTVYQDKNIKVANIDNGEHMSAISGENRIKKNRGSVYTMLSDGINVSVQTKDGDYVYLEDLFVGVNNNGEKIPSLKTRASVLENVEYKTAEYGPEYADNWGGKYFVLKQGQEESPKLKKLIEEGIVESVEVTGELKGRVYAMSSGSSFQMHDVSLEDLSIYNVQSGSVLDKGTAYNYSSGDVNSVGGNQENILTKSSGNDGQYLKDEINIARQDKRDLDIRKQGIINTMYMNLDPGYQDESNWNLFIKNADLAMPFMGTSEEKNLDWHNDVASQKVAVRDYFEQVNFIAENIEGLEKFELTDAQKENWELSTSEKIISGLGGFVPMIAEFAVLGAITGGAGSAVGLTRLVSNLSRVSYIRRGANVVRGSRYTKTAISGDQLKKLAKNAGVSVKEYRKKQGFVIAEKYSTMRRTAGFLIMAGLEEAKMQLMDPLFGVDMGDGTGFGFYAGGAAARWLTPFRFTKEGIGITKGRFAGRELNIFLGSEALGKSIAPSLNVGLEKFFLAGVGGTVGSQVATPVAALVEEWKGNKAFTTFLDEHWHGWEEWGDELLIEVVQFAALGVTHLKKVDGKLTLQAKYDFLKEMKEKRDGYLVTKKGRKISYTDPLTGKKIKPNEKGYIETRNEEVDVENSDMKNFQKFNEIVMMTEAQINTIENAQKYLDINILERETHRSYKKVAKKMKKDGKKPFILKTTRDGKWTDSQGNKRKFGKNEKGKIYDVVVDKKTNEITEIAIDLRKATPGTMPHEIFHFLLGDYVNTLTRDGKNNSTALREKMASNLNQLILKAIKEVKNPDGTMAFGEYMVLPDGTLELKQQRVTDKNGINPGEKGYTPTFQPLTSYQKLVQKNYNRLQEGRDFNEEYVANLLDFAIEMKQVRNLLVENNFLGQVKRDLNSVREAIFNSHPSLERFAPKLDLEKPGDVLESLILMVENLGRGKYSRKKWDKFFEEIKNMRISGDGKVIYDEFTIEGIRTGEELGITQKGQGRSSKIDVKTEIVVNTREEIIKEQKDLQTDILRYNEMYRSGEISLQKFNELTVPLRKRLSEVEANVRANKPVESAKERETREQQEMSDEIQAIYNNTKISKQSKKEKILATNGIQRFINKMVNEKFYSQQNFKESAYKESDFKRDLELVVLEYIYPSPGKIKEFKEAYRPEDGKPLSQYLMFRIRDKIPGILEANIGKDAKTVSGTDAPKLFEGVKSFDASFEKYGEDVTSETTKTSVRLADILTKEVVEKDGFKTTELVVKESTVNGIINNFKLLKNQPKQNAATLDNLVPKEKSDLLGKTEQHTKGAKTGKTDFKKTAKNKIEGLIEMGPARVYTHGVREAIMLRTGVKEIEGVSTLVDPLVLGRFFETGERLSFKETGKGAGIKEQAKIKPPKGDKKVEVTLENGKTIELSEGDVWVLEKLGADIINGQLNLSRIKTQVRSKTDVNINVLLGFEMELLKTLSNQTVREHVKNFEADSKRLEYEANIKSIQNRVESLEKSLENKPDFKTQKTAQREAENLRKEKEKLDKVYEDYGLSEEFQSKDIVNTFIKSVKSAMSEGMSSKISEKDKKDFINAIDRLQRDIDRVRGPITVGELYQIVSNNSYLKDNKAAQDIIQVLSKKIRENTESYKSNIDAQIESLLREAPEVSIQVREAKDYYDAVSQITKRYTESGIDAKTAEYLKKYNAKEQQAAGGKSWRKNEKDLEMEKKLNESLIDKFRDLGLTKDSRLVTLLGKSLLVGAREGKVWDATTKKWRNYTAGEYRLLVEESLKKGKEGEIDLTTKEGRELQEIIDHWNIIETGKDGFKQWQVEFIEKHQGEKGFNRKLAEGAMRKVARDGTVEGFEKTVEANKNLRKLYLTFLKEMVDAAPSGQAKAEAIISVMRHLRAQTGVGLGLMKGTATFTSLSNRLGERKVIKGVEGPPWSMFHAEHQLQLLNHTTMFLDLMLNTPGKFKAGLELLSREFEQASTRYQDVKIYDSPLYGGKTGFIEYFKGRDLGTLSSIANIMYRPGISFEMIDLKAEIPGQTIGERLLKTRNKKDLLDMLDFLKNKHKDMYTAEHAKFSMDVKNKEATITRNKENAKLLEKNGFSSKGLNSKEILENLETLDSARKAGRKIDKKRRGMSTWDFDDTLATTKSGVRARIPSTDGMPKPGRKVIFLAGGAGSGKSNVVKKLELEKQGFKIVNSDISLEWLKKNSGLPENMNDLTREQLSELGKLQHQARKIAKRKMMKFKGNAEGVVIDGTGGSYKAMEKLVNEFKDKGYDVSMLFVETSLETALTRNRARKERSLLDKIVEKNHEAVQGNKDGFKTLFGERFMEVKTDKLKQEDAMPSDLINKMNDFVRSYEKIRLDAEEFASQGKNILDRGGEFDFSEFNVVTEGATGPMFKTALERAKKFGTEHQYVLTARPPESQVPIYEFLKSQGLEIPLKNITGLGNSTGEAKAMWMAEKFAEGYNDMYFADDAIQNVKAVKSVLSQLGVKSKVVQAKSLNDVKDVNKLDSPDVYKNIKSSKIHRAEYEDLVARNRPDLVKENLVSKSVEEMFEVVESLNVPDNKKRKYEKLTTRWLATSSIKPKEDAYKIKQSVELAERYKEDIFSYKNPNEIIEKYAGKAKAKPTSPKTVKEFAKGTVVNKKYGITEHVVENTKEGQDAVRKILDTHWGENSNPWCITQRKDGKLTEQSWQSWQKYSDGPKSIVFQNGKLLAFKANGRYWDRMDNATDAPVINIKKGNVTKKVELVPIGKGKVQEFVIETKTVSKDKKTVTTEYVTETREYEAGSVVVENRNNGITVKKTTSRPAFDVQGKDIMQVVEVVNFNKKGKATGNKNFEDGRLIAVNTYGRPFGEMRPEQIIKEKGDQIERMDLDATGTGTYFAETFVNGKILEIGFQTSTKLEDLIKTSPEGKIRLDLESVLKADPNARAVFAGTRPTTLAEAIKPTKSQLVEGMKGIEPVKKILDQLDMKSEVQQRGPQSMSSKGMKTELGDILNQAIEYKTGVGRYKTYSEAKAKILGSKLKHTRLFGTPGMEDLAGLVTYAFSGKGKQGEAHKKFFEETIHRPFNRAYNEIHSRKQAISSDYKALRELSPEIARTLNERIDNTYTVDHAIRVHLMDLAGMKIPGLSKTDLKRLTDYVRKDADMLAFAERLSSITRLEKGWVEPKSYWLGQNIIMDLNNVVDNVFRKDALSEFVANREAMFGKWENGRLVGENMNKIEAVYGSRHREAIENIFWRMENGTNRTVGRDSNTNKWMNWVNSATSTIMFFNQKSAMLQTISSLNYVNGSFNNPLRAAQAFANMPQYYKDFVKIFNSDMMVQRRAGLKINLEASELIERVGGGVDAFSKFRAYLLEKGFIPTKYADSFAIASGGATFYRNSIRKYKKQGFSEKEAELKAWEDFTEMTEATQQSSRPDLISMQQASTLGRPILAFANTPMQMFRRHKRRLQDIVNNRGNKAENILSALYYGFAQTMIFSFLSNALFAVDDESEDPEDIKFAEKKNSRYTNTIADSYLRGMGTGGAAISALKNGLVSFMKESEKDYKADYGNTIIEMLNVSPPIGSKARKIYTSLKSYTYDKEVMQEMGFDIDNPAVMAIANVISAGTNIPTDRAVMKINNIRDASMGDFETWERIALFMGWNKWALGIEDRSVSVKSVKEAEEKIALRKEMKKYDVTTKEDLKRVKKIKEIRKLNKKQQQELLNKSENLYDWQIYELRTESMRIEKIMEIYESNPNIIDSLLSTPLDKEYNLEDHRYIGK